MKLLMFDTGEFWYRAHSSPETVAETTETEEKITNAIVVFIQAEKVDEDRQNAVVKKAMDHIVWLTKKNERNTILLHSFAHLSESKSDPAVAQDLIRVLEEKLRTKGYIANSTPFGHQYEFKIHVLGPSLAKVWKSI